jgi:hypothetical protein
LTTTPIRNDNAYIGLGKQSAQGTAVAPTSFIRWLDGSKIDWALTTAAVWEGDGSRRLSQIIKNKQEVKITTVLNPRPIELGLLEQAAMGASSDAVTAATVSTTLSAATLANATNITVAANTGLTGSGTITLVLEPGTATEEIAIFDIPATGSSTPYTLTVDASYNGGHLKLAHSSSGVVQAATAHVLTDQLDGSYYTVEVGIGTLNSGGGLTLRVRDCKVDSIKRSSKAGELLAYEVTWVGIAVAIQATPATVTYENHQSFLYTQGVWTINGATTGDALAIESFDISQKNNVNGPQTESLVLAALIFGKVEVDVSFDFTMQNAQLILLTMAGSTSGTADAQTVGSGSMNLVFTQADGFHSVAYNMQTLNYTKVPVPEPKADGKYYKVAASAASTSNMGQNTYVLQTTVNNAKTAAY